MWALQPFTAEESKVQGGEEFLFVPSKGASQGDPRLQAWLAGSPRPCLPSAPGPTAAGSTCLPASSARLRLSGAVFCLPCLRHLHFRRCQAQAPMWRRKQARVNAEANKEPAEAQLRELTGCPSTEHAAGYISASPALLAATAEKQGSCFPCALCYI